MLMCAALSLSCIAATAQTRGTIKIYAYKQASVPGVNRQIAEEGKSPIEQSSSQKFTYHLFAVSPETAYPVTVWIDGQEFSAKGYRERTTPVEMKVQDGEKVQTKVLVPVSQLQVLRITPMPLIAGKSMPAAKKAADENEFVLVYKKDGKFYYNFINKIELLPPVVLQ